MKSSKETLEEHIYTLIGKEIESKNYDFALWVKAQELSGGSNDKCISEYIRLRREKLTQELQEDSINLEELPPKYAELKRTEAQVKSLDKNLVNNISNTLLIWVGLLAVTGGAALIFDEYVHPRFFVFSLILGFFYLLKAIYELIDFRRTNKRN